MNDVIEKSETISKNFELIKETKKLKDNFSSDFDIVIRTTRYDNPEYYKIKINRKTFSGQDKRVHDIFIKNINQAFENLRSNILADLIILENKVINENEKLIK